MRIVGTFGVERRFSRLFGRIVRLVRAEAADRERRIARAIDKLKMLRAGSTLGGLSWKSLRDEGRR